MTRAAAPASHAAETCRSAVKASAGLDWYRTRVAMPIATTRRRRVDNRRDTDRASAYRVWLLVESPQAFVLHAPCTRQELDVGDDLLHRAHVHLAWTEAGRTGVALEGLAVGQVRGAEIQLARRRLDRVAQLL